MKQLMIAHRGNLTGPNPDEENKPEYLLKAIESGYNIEADFWVLGNHVYLGHDYAAYKTNWRFVWDIRNHVWAHAKNTEALLLLQDVGANCFWHETDERTLTSHGYIWTYPGKEIAYKKAIAVMPETVKDWDVSGAYGICSDYVNR